MAPVVVVIAPFFTAIILATRQVVGMSSLDGSHVAQRGSLSGSLVA
jgi:hypothetical protein